MNIKILFVLISFSCASEVEIDTDDHWSLVDVGDDDYSKMLTCPFPAPEVISPCRCYGDSSYRIHLICNLQSDLESDLLRIISKSFSCKPIHHLEFNLSGHKWLAGFTGEHFSDLVLEKIVIRNASSVEGDWFSGKVFNSSATTLREFVMEPSTIPGHKKLISGAFSGLKKLRVVKLGKSYWY